MATVRLGGPSVPLPTFPGLVNNSSAQGSAPYTAGYYTGLTNAISLAASAEYYIPSGTWWVFPGPYTFLQWKDPYSAKFTVRPTSATGVHYIDSDGTNYKLANTTGCPVGASITAVGTAGVFTTGIGTTATGLTVTASSGSSTWTPIIGGAISTTLATSTGTTTAGSGYLYPPLCIIDAPPTGGLQATAIVTSISSGTVPVANVQVINQGAGYPAAPNLTFLNDPRDTAGSGAVVVLTLTGTGVLTGLYPSNHGTPLTGVPTLTFSTSTAAATCIMNFTVTSYATTGIVTGSSIQAAEVTSIGNLVAAQASPAPINPLHSNGVTFPRPARIAAEISSGGIIATGQTVEDGGLGIQQVPSAVISYSITSTTAIVPSLTTLNVGGVTDTSYIQPV